MRVHVGSPCVFLVRRFAANRDRERAVTISQLMLVGTLPDKLNLNGHGAILDFQWSTRCAP